MSKILGVPDIVLFLVFLSPLARSPLLPFALRFSIQNPRRSEPAVVLARQRGSARKEEKKREGPALASIVGATFFFFLPARREQKPSEAKEKFRKRASERMLIGASALRLAFISTAPRHHASRGWQAPQRGGGESS